MRNLILVAILVLTGACSTGGPPPTSPATAEPAGVPDSRIGLAPGTVFEQPPQQPIPFITAEPGESSLRPRPNPQFPPAIPHSIADLERITVDEHPCLECHLGAAAEDVGATPIPPSHHVDLRNSPETTSEELEGARTNCTSCHVPQTDAPPLVDNRARG